MSSSHKYEKYVSSRQNIEKIKMAFIIEHNKKIKNKGQMLRTSTQLLKAVV